MKLSIFLLAFAIIAGCSADDPAPTRVELLTAHTWKYAKVNGQPKNPDGGSVTVYEWTITIHETGQFNEDYKNLSTGSTAGTTGTWNLSSNGETLTVTMINGSVRVYTIESVTTTSLKWTFNNTSSLRTEEFVVK